MSVESIMEQGSRDAYALGNRGPLRFNGNGEVDASILDAYWQHGFYVLEGALSDVEIDDLQREFSDLLARAPASQGANVDNCGNSIDFDARQQRMFRFVKPLTDPYGGTDSTNSRYQVKMREPDLPADAPADVLLQIGGILQFMDSTLRVYGHPGLLKLTEAINGPDFTPFSEVIWIKQARYGAAVSWHQDGTTHWDSADLDMGSHGFNFMVNLKPTTPENSLWIVPGTHRGGKADLTAMVSASASDRIDGAVPLLCEPGDIAVCNRQVVHGSFPNTSTHARATFVFGFHRRASVAGVKGWAKEPYSDEFLDRCSRLIPLSIAARRAYFPEEEPYAYAPSNEPEELELNAATRQELLYDYHTRMIGI